MKISSTAVAAVAAMTLAASPAAAADDDAPIIERPDYTPVNGVFDIDALEALGRVNAATVSPDGRTVLVTLSYESVEQNRSNADLYLVPVKGGELTRITRTPKSEGGAVWIDGGRRIAFTYPDADGNAQVWVMKADGSERRQISKVEKGVSGFLFAPDGRHVLLMANVKYARTPQDVYPDLPKANARIVDDLMYKHWDEWVTEIPHPWLGEYDGNEITGLKDIMEGEPYESPMKPWGGVESWAWAPDSKSLVYVSRKKTGVDYALSTNSDLYLYTLADGTTRNLTEGMMGYDTLPVFSPDGKSLAWLSMEHDGYEADKNRIFLLDLATGRKTDLTTDWDYTVDQIAWAPSSRSLFFICYHQGVAPVFNIDVKTCKITTLDSGQYDYTGLSVVDDNTVVTLRHSMVRPNEVYTVARGAKVKAITDVNGKLFTHLNMPEVKERWVPTTDGKKMLTWVVYPPHFDPTKKYPALLYLQGGPQSAVSQFWSYRWNLALMASHGYVVVAPNRRGVPGFGSEWLSQISKDYTGQNMRDYLSAIDDVRGEAYIDTARVGATGASYGGYSTYWLAGNHEHRFAAFLAHAGIFNTEAQYLETEEMWFANWDMGGAYWEKDNAAAQRTHQLSPHRFVDRWDTPIMISHGDFDYRILSSQGQMAFNAAKLRGIPAEMVLFPEENHWILKPQNAVLWQRLFFRWFDRWLKAEK